ncbi:hypothetical protein V5H98_08925 [Georgenia sp. M64]|uniref:hypothetical protein n=1 Tax=Georgenia sp. M64 TaxID=3120520 RepID=UPI0030E20AE4
MTTTALRWLEPGHPEPVRAVELPGGGGPREDALLAGARLDGLLCPGPDGRAATLDLAGSAAARASSLAGRVPGGGAVCLGTAVWVHTGLSHPGHLQVCPAPGAGRVGTVALTLVEDDVVVLESLTVTTPLRTACDIARLAPLDRAATGLLALRRTGLDLAEVSAALALQRRRPFVQRGRDLVALLL